MMVPSAAMDTTPTTPSAVWYKTGRRPSKCYSDDVTRKVEEITAAMPELDTTLEVEPLLKSAARRLSINKAELSGLNVEERADIILSTLAFDAQYDDDP